MWIFVSVDGTNCGVYDLMPFNKKLYSDKHKGTGLHYEIGLPLSTKDSVSLSGSFPCGSFPDVIILRHGMKMDLEQGERVAADKTNAAAHQMS